METDISATAEPEFWSLYRQFSFSRLYEEAVTEVWAEGLICGDMHLGTGEEGIVASVPANLEEEVARAVGAAVATALEGA